MERDQEQQQFLIDEELLRTARRSNELTRRACRTKVEKKLDARHLVEELTMGDMLDDPFELSKALDEHGGNFVFWSTMLTEAKMALEKAQYNWDLWEATARDDARKQLNDKGIKNPTMKDLDLCIVGMFESNGQYIKLQRQLIMARRDVEMLEIAVKAWGYRKDALVTLGSLMGKLIDNGLIILDRKEGRITSSGAKISKGSFEKGRKE